MDQQPIPASKPYKPRILRTGTLSVLVVVTLVLIILVEIACHALPQTTTGDLIDEVLEKRMEIESIHSLSTKKTEGVIRTIIVTHNRDVFAEGTPYVQFKVPRETNKRWASTLDPDTFLHTQESILVPISIPHETQSPVLTTVVAPNPTAFLQTVVTPTASGTFAPNPNAYLQPTHTPTAPNRHTFFSPLGPVHTVGDYFLGSYVPTLAAVLYGMPWAILYRQLLLLEPFYCLSDDRGAKASQTLTRNFSSLKAPVIALVHGEKSVLIATVLLGFSILITPLAPEAISIHTIGTCDATSAGCTGEIGVLTPAARTIEAILCVMALLAIWLIFILRERKLRLRADPSSLAGLATLFWSYDVRRDFTALLPPTSDKQLKRALRTYHYKLDTMVYPNGTQVLTIVKAVGNGSPTLEYRQKHEYAAVDWTLKMSPLHRLKAVIFFIFLLGLATLIIAYRYTGGNTGFERFMDSQGFGVRFLFTLIGVVISQFWNSVFQDTTRLAPYRSLALGHARAEESILFTTPSHEITALFPALRNGQIILSLITVATLLSHVLTVTLSTVPFNNANSWNAYVASTWISIAVILIMLNVLGTWFFYHEPNLPLKPDTLAANLFYLCGSRLPDIFATMGTLDTKTRDQRISNLNYRYTLAKIQAMDGVVRVTVEAEG